MRSTNSLVAPRDPGCILKRLEILPSSSVRTVGSPGSHRFRSQRRGRTRRCRARPCGHLVEGVRLHHRLQSAPTRKPGLHLLHGLVSRLLNGRLGCVGLVICGPRRKVVFDGVSTFPPLLSRWCGGRPGRWLPCRQNVRIWETPTRPSVSPRLTGQGSGHVDAASLSAGYALSVLLRS